VRRKGPTIARDSLWATIDLGGSDHYVELWYPVRFTLGDDPDMRRVVTFALNSQAWLMSGALQSGQVEDDVLQAHISAATSLEVR